MSQEDGELIVGTRKLLGDTLRSLHAFLFELHSKASFQNGSLETKSTDGVLPLVSLRAEVDSKLQELGERLKAVESNSSDHHKVCFIFYFMYLKLFAWECAIGCYILPLSRPSCLALSSC